MDWPLSLKAAQRIVGERTAIQGNMDPAALLADPAAAAAAAKKTLSDFGDSPGHIFNLGHGVDKTTPPDNVQALTDTVPRSYPSQYSGLTSPFAEIFMGGG